MASSLTVLLPPSEGKAEGGVAPRSAGQLQRSLAVGRASVIEALRAELDQASAARRAAILGVRGPLLERAEAATELLCSGSAPVLPAWQRYTGVVWSHLEPQTLDAELLRRALVPSGLLGLTLGTDPVPDYRLKMSVALAGLGRLSSFWRDDLTALVARRCAGEVVVNLLPAEHANAFDWPLLGERCEVLEVRFLTGDRRAAAGHAAKAVKGALARALLCDGEAALEKFSFDGWKLRRRGSVVELIAG